MYGSLGPPAPIDHGTRLQYPWLQPAHPRKMQLENFFESFTKTSKDLLAAKTIEHTAHTPVVKDTHRIA
jgi:hypothetical protein